MTTVSLLVTALPTSQAIAQTPPAAPRADAPVTDPIPQDPVPSTLGLTLADVATFPKSEPVPAPIDPRLMRHARINFLGEIPDGSGRRFVPDLNGTMYLLNGATPGAYLDVRAQFPDFFSGRGMGSGFGFVTFHPEFARNGRFYTVHSEAFGALQPKTPDWTQPNAIVQSVVTEWTAADPSANTFSGTHREVLRLGFASYIHAIQQIDFNPTARPRDKDYGLLYVAAGDGGIGVSTNVPQDLAVPQGKILRIDPMGRDSANGNYGIPRSNPFVGKPGALGEIYAYGMRDPHRFSWDPRDGDRMFLGHIGEHAIEAVYEVKAGDNFGWSEREGAFAFKKDDRCNLFPLPADDKKYGYTYPVAAYDHDPPAGWPCTKDSGHAISGGFVYRGNAVPELRGKYVFADLVDGRVFYTNANEMRRGRKLATIYDLKIFDPAGKRVTTADLAGDARVDLRLGTDRAGELYLLAKANGKLWKVTGTRRVPVNPDVLPSLQRNLAAFYDFEHAFVPDPAMELDQGFSGTNISLVNGGKAMRVKDGAYPGSNTSIQTAQVNPATAGNDDWKAGLYSATGVPTLNAFNGVKGTTVMGWFKVTGQNPNLNSNTPDPNDYYNAIGLAGILTGDSDGHGVRALLELINVNGELRLVALGRRLDGGSSQTFAAQEDWRTLLPPNEWVFLAATFDFDKGTMALYKNGKPLDGFYAVTGDPWGVATPGRHYSSETDPRGIKIGGSFPQNTRESNPCNCRMDSLMFLGRTVSAAEVQQQYRRVTTARP
ncbi:PQQ-dependent sugar dehydrogenase [Micromonospora sp. NPDC049679]|uniref:PQQ-dependent sugar dehydrogenase n=1 Tax=Micromonospora sp. NPDC049679 TaxID=3155920 RepID=UPI003401C3B5